LGRYLYPSWASNHHDLGRKRNHLFAANNIMLCITYLSKTKHHWFSFFYTFFPSSILRWKRSRYSFNLRRYSRIALSISIILLFCLSWRSSPTIERKSPRILKITWPNYLWRYPFSLSWPYSSPYSCKFCSLKESIFYLRDFILRLNS
jgi:hypothetical protein